MKTTKDKKRAFLTLMEAVVGVVLAIVAAIILQANSYKNAEQLARGTTETLVRQCQSFDNIQAVNRVRALFSLSENVTSLNASFERDPSTASDEFLEDYVDGMQLTGVAVLDGDLKLEASGYTRGLASADWKDDFYPGLFENMLGNPEQVYARRMNVDGQYYDVCAAARTDAPGVIVAYYKQPMKGIYDTERDLKQLLKNVRMDLNGDFVIFRDGQLISEGGFFSDSEEFAACADKTCDAKGISPLTFDGKRFFGTRVISGDYSIYLYFPFWSVFFNALVGELIFVLAYASVCFAASAFVSRAERSKRKALEESNRQLVESASIMKSLETIYFTIFFVDLEKDWYRGIIVAPWIENIVEQSGDFTTSMNKLIDSSVGEKYREEIREKLDFDFIRAQLRKSDTKPSAPSYYSDYEVDINGKTAWCRITLTGVDFGLDGNPEKVLVMLQDVDVEKSKEVEYQEQIIKEADLAQSANRAKSAFLFNVSHDIRTPLNAILGYGELAKKSAAKGKNIDGYLENIQVSGERLLSLINEVLELARIENGKTEIKPKAARAGDGIRSCMVIVDPSAKANGVTMELKTDFLTPYIFIDHARMSRIVLNLLNNAIKFTPRGGKVTVFANHRSSEEEGKVIVEVIVSDTGVGISKEFLPRMFDMFEREGSNANGGAQGTGLGLGIVKRLVELMNGTVSVGSEVGKGSTFTVRIPCSVASEDSVKATTLIYRAKPESVEGKRVLIAEDGEMNAEILTEIISETGIAVDLARDGEQCLDMLENSKDGYYDMVFMDIQMPKLDGFAAAKAIRKNPRRYISSIPVVAMTANAFPEDRARSKEAGMDEHLSKPIDANELAFAFEKYLGAELICEERVKIRGGGYK